MIGYVTLGTNDMDRATSFYDSLLAVIGAGQMWKTDRTVFWGTGAGAPALAVIKPYDGQPATAGNGTMVALVVDANEKVDAVHKKALELGGRDEGAPGPRAVETFYAGYFRDPDGNKLCVFHLSS